MVDLKYCSDLKVAFIYLILLITIWFTNAIIFYIPNKIGRKMNFFDYQLFYEFKI